MGERPYAIKGFNIPPIVILNFGTHFEVVTLRDHATTLSWNREGYTKRVDKGV